MSRSDDDESASAPGGCILVPPSRVEGNPLADLLRRRGALVLEVPALVARPPRAHDDLVRAAAGFDRYDWVLFSGGRSAANYLELRARLEPGEKKAPARIATIGGGARAAVRARGWDSDYHPPRHTAEEVAAGWPLPGNSRILLVRAEGAGDELPRALMARRARVATVDGYGVELEMPPGAAAELGTVDRVGFANGTAARHLAEGLGRVGDGAAIPATARIVAVGAATAAIASSLGFAVSAVADGGLIGLADLLLSA